MKINDNSENLGSQYRQISDNQVIHDELQFEKDCDMIMNDYLVNDRVLDGMDIENKMGS